MKDIIIIGTGGHSKICKYIIDNYYSDQFNFVGFVCNDSDKISDFKFKIAGSDKDLECLFENGVKNLVFGLGLVNKHKLRQKFIKKISDVGFNLPNIIHGNSFIEKDVILGFGNQIMLGAKIGNNVSIGNNCIINTGSIISHDCKIGNNVHIAPGAIIAGGVEIGDNTLIGMGVTTLFGISIGQNVIITNGVNIYNNILDNKIIKSKV